MSQIEDATIAAPVVSQPTASRVSARRSPLLNGEVVTAALIVVVALLALADSFKTSGWTATGPDAGFYPFWSAMLMGVAAVVVLLRALRARVKRDFFGSREGAKAFWQLAIPMVFVVLLINWFGFYLVSGAYMAFFDRWIGRYRWPAVAALGVGIPLALYLSFEQGFRVPLPKSMFYRMGITPF